MIAFLLCGLFDTIPPARAQFQFRTEYQLDRDAIEIPFEYKEHQILVRGDADTAKDLTFLFDTGASAPVLDSGLDLKAYHLPDSLVHEASGQLRAEMVSLDFLKLHGADGEARVHNIAALRTDLSQLTRLIGRKIDGILGITFMSGFVIEIDYAKKVLRFYDPTTLSLSRRQPDNRRTFLFDLNPANPEKPTGCMVITGKLHPKYEYDFLLDSGFGGYVSVAHASAEESGIYRDSMPRILTTSYTVSSSFRSAKIRAEFLTLGEINLSSRVIQVDVRNADAYGQIGIIGNRFLQNYRLIMDYPRRKLWLERVTEKEETDEAERPSFGIAILADGKRIAVDRVSKRSPAEKAGVRAGDLLFSIDDLVVADMKVVEVANLLTQAHGKTRFVFEREQSAANGLAVEKISLTLTPTTPLDWGTAQSVH